MTDNVQNTIASPVQDTPVNPTQDTPSAPSPKAPSPKSTNTAAKAKKGRRTRRRRVATSDAGSASESETGAAEDADSASSDSDQSADDASDDDEDDHSAKPTSSSPARPTGDLPKPVFADVDSTTPAAWAEGSDAKGEAVSFDDFKAEESTAAGRGRGRGRGGAAERGRGRGAFTANGERRELTEAEKEKLAAKRAKQKEKLKAKKAAKKEEAKAVKQATASTAPSSAPKAESTDLEAAPPTDSLVASTSALTIEDPAATTPPTPAVAVLEDEAMAENAKLPHRPNRVNNREAYAERIAADPKFTPRVGNFWTHDQRLYEGGAVGEGGFAGLRQMSDYWRGRAMPRGGFRGFRGRGAPNGFPGGFRGRGGRFPPTELHVPKQEERGKGLEMDKLEKELEEKRERARAARAAAEEAQAVAASDGQAEPQSVEADSEPTVTSPQLAATSQDRPPIARPGNKWGHEAYEAIQASEIQVRPFNPLLRGRGRGRGGFRGFPHPHPGAFGPPRPLHPAANGPGPQQQRDVSAAAPRPESRAAEASSTAPAAESLLSSTASVTVRLPGAPAAEAVPAVAPEAVPPPVVKPPRSTTSSSRSPAPTAAPFIPAHQQLPPDANGYPAQQASPVPYLAQHDTGSVSSGHFSQQHTGYGPAPPAPVPQVPMPAEYFAQASPMPRVMPPQPHNPYMPNGRPYPYYPQDFQPRSSFSAPVPAPSPPVFYPQHSNQGSFDARSASPFPQQQMPMVEGGYFVPPQRGQKISIRAPKSKGAPDGAAEYANVSAPYFDANGQTAPYNPYAGQALQGEEAYYAQNGRYWQGGNGYEVPAYGYDTYQGY